jgi:hypothetical protein
MSIASRPSSTRSPTRYGPLKPLAIGPRGLEPVAGEQIEDRDLALAIRVARTRRQRVAVQVLWQ